MKNLNLIAWLTQLGLSVAIPPTGGILLALWLRDFCGWGSWVLWVGIVLGIVGAFSGLKASLRAMERMSRSEKEKDIPVSFNEHE